MTGLVQDLPGQHLFVRSVSEEGIRIGADLYSGAVVFSRETAISNWPVGSIDDLQEENFAVIYELEPEIVLIGVGAKQQFLHPQKLAGFYQRDIGVEVMTTDAACRTFNILASDDRRVVAALLPLAE